MDQLLTTLSDFGVTGTSAYLYVALAMILIAAVVVISLKIIYAVAKHYFRKQNERDLAVISVSLPKFNPDDKEGSGQPKNHQELVDKLSNAEAMMNSIAGLSAQKGWKADLFGRTDYYSFEIVFKNNLIYFYVAAPREHLQFIKEQVTAQFPTASVEDEEDYNIFQPEGVIEGMELKFAKEYIYPLKTYKDIETDSLSSMTNSLSKLPEGTGAAIQFLTRSANPRWHKWGQKAASKASQGKKLTEAIKEAKHGKNPIVEMMELMKPADKKEGEKKEYRLSQMEQEAVKKIEEKSAKNGLETNIRIVVAAPTEATARMAMDNVYNSFSQFNINQFGNAFKKGKFKKDSLIQNFIFREFNEKNIMIMNAEEAGSIFHFPLPHIETPNIAWLSSRRVGLPSGMPTEGTLLGYNDYRGVKTPVYMKMKDRHRHMYVIGMTGSGKSKLLDMMCINDIKAGRGVCFIDPHGDDTDLILANIPKERMNDVIVLDPSDAERPLALNMLEYQNFDQRNFVVNEVFNIFDKLYDLKATGGPMFEQYMKNAMLLIMEDPDSGMTLLEVSRVLSDDDFRAYKLSKCKTQVVKNFWEKEAQKAGGDASLANMVPYITSKMAPFFANDLIRPIISQQKSSFNFREAMDTQKILIIQLQKGKIGDINAFLLGMIIVGKLLGAALSRSDTPEDQRKEFFLYIDEFQNFLTDSIESILSEARKYKLCLHIAHQYVGQLTRANGDVKIRNAIFGNVGSKVVFRIGTEDAEALVKEFKPVFNEYDLLNQPALSAIGKLLVNQANVRPFNIKMIDMKEWNHEDSVLAREIKQISKMKYGTPRQEIEDEVNARLKKEWKVEGATPNLDDISLEDLFK